MGGWGIDALRLGWCIDALRLDWWVELGLRMLRMLRLLRLRVVGVEIWWGWKRLSVWVIEVRMDIGVGWLGWRWWKLVGGIGVEVVLVERGRRLVMDVVGLVVLRVLVVTPVQGEVGVDVLERGSERWT